jgi:hypothetical protein
MGPIADTAWSTLTPEQILAVAGLTLMTPASIGVDLMRKSYK